VVRLVSIFLFRSVGVGPVLCNGLLLALLFVSP
jgi:hypothetical protein